MSVDATIYLGPYARCEVKPATREREVKTCSNVACAGYTKTGRAAFCSTCGSAIAPRMMIEPYEPSIDDVLGDFVDDLQHLNDGYRHTKGEPYYFGSNLREPLPGRTFSVESVTHLDISAIDARAEMQWFEERYFEPIRRLQQAYANVRIGWGLHVFDT